MSVGPVRLYIRCAGASLRGQMQHRASFLMESAGMLIITALEFAGIWAMFDRFGSLRGWRLAEVAVLYGLVSVGFALAEGIGSGFDRFDLLVRHGGFDRLLLRPRATALQVAAHEVRLMRVGRLVQGLLVLGLGAAGLNVRWTPGRLALAASAVLGGACLFYALLVLQAALSFWTTESLELFNIVTYGGCEIGQYPLGIYRPAMRRFFTFVVPVACVTYFPALAILDRPDGLMGTPRPFHWLAPWVGVLFLAGALQVWRIGVRHYTSTGS